MPNENEKDDDLDEDEFVDDMSKDGKNKIVDDDMDDEDKMSGEKVETRKCPKCGGKMRKQGDKWVCQDCEHEMPA